MVVLSCVRDIWQYRGHVERIIRSSLDSTRGNCLVFINPMHWQAECKPLGALPSYWQLWENIRDHDFGEEFKNVGGMWLSIHVPESCLITGIIAWQGFVRSWVPFEFEPCHGMNLEHSSSEHVLAGHKISIRVEEDTFQRSFGSIIPRSFIDFWDLICTVSKLTRLFILPIRL